MRVLLLNHFPLFGSGSGVYTLNIANSLTDLGHEVVCVFPDNEPDETEYKFRTHPVYFAKEGASGVGTSGTLSASGAVSASGASGAVSTPGATCVGTSGVGTSGADATGTTGTSVAGTIGAGTLNNPLSFNFPCFTTHPKSSNTFEDLTQDQEEQYLKTFRDVIAEEIETFKPDIIHAGHIWVLAALGAETDLPTIVTAHGTDLIGYRQSERYHDIAHEAAKNASAIVAISQRNYQGVVDTFPFAKDKTKLISNGFDTNRFYPEKIARAEVLARYGITRKYERMVCFAGKFAHFKGIDILLHAVSEYEDDDTITVLAGNGDLFDEMQELARKLGLKNVKFLGAQTPDDLRSIYSVADVSCAPSRREPFGLVVIEAGACGTPVIGTNGGGIADILMPETGILIDEEDASALARAVREILSGEKTFDREYIAKYTRDNFAQAQYTKKLVDEVYKPAVS